jgi:hypothetical protein
VPDQFDTYIDTNFASYISAYCAYCYKQNLHISSLARAPSVAHVSILQNIQIRFYPDLFQRMISEGCHLFKIE